MRTNVSIAPVARLKAPKLPSAKGSSMLKALLSVKTPKMGATAKFGKISTAVPKMSKSSMPKASSLSSALKGIISSSKKSGGIAKLTNSPGTMAPPPPAQPSFFGAVNPKALL